MSRGRALSVSQEPICPGNPPSSRRLPSPRRGQRAGKRSLPGLPRRPLRPQVRSTDAPAPLPPDPPPHRRLPASHGPRLTPAPRAYRAPGLPPAARPAPCPQRRASPSPSPSPRAPAPTQPGARVSALPKPLQAPAPPAPPCVPAARFTPRPSSRRPCRHTPRPPCVPRAPTLQPPCPRPRHPSHADPSPARLQAQSRPRRQSARARMRINLCIHTQRGAPPAAAP